MKIASCVLLLSLSVPSLFAQRYYAAPDVPSTAPNPQYPLHVHVFANHYNYDNGGYHGYGRADILGTKPSGFDYTYSCSEPFLHNAQAAEFFQAKWKKQNEKLELLMLKVGSNREQKCQLNVTLKQTPYGQYGTSAAPEPAQPH